MQATLSFTRFSFLPSPLIPVFISPFIPLSFFSPHVYSPFHLWHSSFYMLCIIPLLLLYHSFLLIFFLFSLLFIVVLPFSISSSTVLDPFLLSRLPIFLSLCPFLRLLSHQLPPPHSFSFSSSLSFSVSFPSSLSALSSPLIRLLAFSLRCLYDHWNNSTVRVSSALYLLLLLCLFILHFYSLPPPPFTNHLFSRSILSSSCALASLPIFLSVSPFTVSLDCLLLHPFHNSAPQLCYLCPPSLFLCAVLSFMPFIFPSLFPRPLP